MTSSSCAATYLEARPWWRLDLQAEFRVSIVVVTYREDCCPDNRRDFEIRFGSSLQDNGNTNPSCAAISSDAVANSVTYSCSDRKGQYVNILLNGLFKAIFVCEVEVYESDYFARSFMKITFNSNANLTDPTVKDNLLKELKSALTWRGNTYVTLSWSQPPAKVVMQNQHENAESRTNQEALDMNMRVFCRILSLLLGVFSVQIKAHGTEVNIAGWGIANQSTLFTSWYAQNAVDGKNYTCSHTESQSDPWWTLDLLKTYSVNRVTITNRPDCCGSRINGTEIRVGNDSSDVFSNPVCAVVSTIPAGATYSYWCHGMEGRYVSANIPGTSKILTLCELGVYVIFPDNLATGRNVTQSSTYGNWSAEHAIDFNPGFRKSWSACSSTAGGTNPWWRLDLSSVYRVRRVVVTNRLDCCPQRINGTEIRIGNSLENNGNNNPICAVISSVPGGVSSTYVCNNMEGRYVNLLLPGDSKILTLCEVEVYGEGPLLVKTFVKIKLKSNSSLSEPEMRVQLLSQLESALADQGVSDEGVTLQWSQPPKQEVMQKEAVPAQCARRKW
ncbi:uncharacterized protein LOC127168151 isoform X2 [Labeo rohita]|nr:uncharacterized protein LOC127168151 isoform X2 [Labeo rohita]